MTELPTLLDVDAEQERLIAFRVQITETPGGVVVKRGCVEMHAEGEGARQLVTFIVTLAERGISRAELAGRLPEGARQPALDLVDELTRRRLLVPAATAPDAREPEGPLDVFYWHFGTTADDVAERLAARRIMVVGVNAISVRMAELWREADGEMTLVDHPILRNAAVLATVADEVAPWEDTLAEDELDCLVATSDSGGMHALRRFNELCVRTATRFFPVVLQDLVGWVGPVVVPGETACLECVRARQNSTMADPALRRASEATAATGAVTGHHPAMAGVLADLAVIELTKLYSGALYQRRPTELIEVNLLAPALQVHRVLKVPRCEVCGPLRSRATTTPKDNPFRPPGQPR
jgi:bacteriocin biosynthesis cyclodehydratase domain-containing protein